jgi:DNA-binding transcriptional LysR family regulator
MSPLVVEFLRRYPDMTIDIVTEGRLVDVVADGFDLGVRVAGLVPSDMIAVPLGRPQRYAVVGSPGYFERHGKLGSRRTFFVISASGFDSPMAGCFAGVSRRTARSLSWMSAARSFWTKAASRASPCARASASASSSSRMSSPTSQAATSSASWTIGRHLPRGFAFTIPVAEISRRA